MLSPFALGRRILFCILFALNLASLVFSTWNAIVTFTLGLQIASAFLVLNSSLVMVALIGAFADVYFLNPWTSFIGFECAWTLTMTFSQIAAAVTATVLGPSVQCVPSVDWTVCATAALIVPLSWLCATTLGVYAVTLSVTSMVHREAVPALWCCQVSRAPWFVKLETGQSIGLRPAPLPRAGPRRQSTDSEFSYPPFSLDRPIWAQKIQTRPARDHPFLLPNARKSGAKVTKGSQDGPRRGQRHKIALGADYADLTRAAQIPLVLLRPMFPSFSEIVRSDLEKGIDFHTVPEPSPTMF